METRRHPRPAARSEAPGDVLHDRLAPFMALYEFAPVGAALISADGRILGANRGFQDFIGYTGKELRELRFDDITYGPDVAAARKMFGRLRKGEVRYYELEKRYVRKGGRIAWGRLAASALGPGCEPAFCLGLVVDITERKANEQALRRSEEKYRSLYNRTPVMVHSIDSEDRLQSVSDRWLSTLGYSREEVLGRKSTEFLTPESRRYAEEVVLPAFFKTGSCSDVPYQFVTREGEILDIELSATCERDQDDRVVRSLAVLIDVTARRRAERALARLTAELDHRVVDRTSELRLKAALLSAEQEASIDGMLAVDPDRRIISYNRRFVEMWGLSPELLATRSDEAAVRQVLYKLADPAAFLERIAQLYEDRTSRSFEEIELRDGRTFERYSSPVVGEGGRHYGRIWYFRDITRRKQAELEVLRKTEALARSNADLEAYAYSVSHDLRAPVSKISACARLLERPAAGLAERDRCLVERIRKSAERMAAMIGDILSLSRIGRSDEPTQLVDVGRVMDLVLSDLELPIKEAGAAVVTGPLPQLRAHEALIRRLLQNLICNAVKFRRPGVAPRVRVESRLTADGVELSVSDNGIGFDPKRADRIFEPFVRLHRGYEGEGIGLAVCQRIAQRYGGRITAASELDRGSTFTVHLPRAVLA